MINRCESGRFALNDDVIAQYFKVSLFELLSYIYMHERDQLMEKYLLYTIFLKFEQKFFWNH